MAELPKDNLTVCSAFFLFFGSINFYAIYMKLKESHMKILKHLTDILGKSRRPVKPERYNKIYVGVKYRAFQELLSQNNTVLRIMADIESRLSGDSIPEMKNLKLDFSQVKERVHVIINLLNSVSRDRYLVLHDRYQEISGEIENILTERIEIPEGIYTMPFSQITRRNMYEFGNKNANLGEVKNQLHIPTPDGFAISTFAFKKFLEYNQLFTIAQDLELALRAGDTDSINHMSGELRRRIVQSNLPPDLETEIQDSYLRFCEQNGRPVRVAVRSSAIHEDSELSFAGQYATFLNVPPQQIIQKYKEVVASLFSSGALHYFKTKGFQEFEMAMSVGILEMVDAKAAGVLYTRDPGTAEDDSIIISAVFGMGRAVVEGLATPAMYRVSRHPSFNIAAVKTQAQTDMLVSRNNGDIEKIPLPQSLRTRPCLSDEHIKTLAKYAIAIEEHYLRPQDIEWAVDKDGKVFILQTRPLMISAIQDAVKPSAPIKGHKALLSSGITASKGTGYGKAVVMNIADDPDTFPGNSVLVVKYTSTRFAPIIEKASAIVTDIGSSTMHMATIAREFGVPAIVGTDVATQILTSGKDVTVDATNCIVYEGIVEELIEAKDKEKVILPEAPFLTSLRRAGALVIPLTLIKPDDETFKPELCKTLHDITRFAHQKAMHEMFKITREYPEDIEAHRLKAGIPLSIDIIDLEGSVELDHKKLLPEHIHSSPFKAFLAGLSSLPWPEPRHIDVKGFFGMVAHTATIPEEELERMAERSFVFLSKEYMNFSIRLGYHLSVVEAYAGENINDNYIRFFFKGGGADLERRLRRVDLINAVLQKLGFYTKGSEDIIDALLTKDTRTNLKEKLTVLGKLTVYTKQMDAIMPDDEATKNYLEEFLREHFPLDL